MIRLIVFVIFLPIFILGVLINNVKNMFYAGYLFMENIWDKNILKEPE